MREPAMMRHPRAALASSEASASCFDVRRKIFQLVMGILSAAGKPSARRAHRSKQPVADVTSKEGDLQRAIALYEQGVV